MQMIKNIYEQIRYKEKQIEEKRINIKKIKNAKGNIHNVMDTISNIYEYFAAPLCAISISLTAFFTGPIVYALPIATAACAISIVSYKFSLRRKLDLLNKRMAILKDERQELYEQREQLYEDMFNKLQHQNLDKKDYYHQILEAEKSCQDLTVSMLPYKSRKKKYITTRKVISRTFDYGLAPTATVILPLVCALISMSPLGQVISMSTSSALLLGCASVDDYLAKKIEEQDSFIQDIKSDRTVKYVQRDMKLKESLEYLNREYFKILSKERQKYQKNREELTIRSEKKVSKDKKKK